MATDFLEEINNSTEFQKEKGFQLPRINSPRKDMTRGAFKAMTMRNINKHIKQNDIESLLGETRDTLPINDSEMQFFDERKEVHNNLTHLRKRYDEFKEMASKKEKEISKIRADIEKLRLEEEILKGDTGALNERLADMEEKHEQTKMKQEEALLQKKTFEHMLDRMKKDKLAHKIKSSHLESDLNSSISKLSGISLVSQKSKQSQLKSQYALDLLMKSVEKEQKQREKQLNQFRTSMRNLQEAERKRDERIKRQNDIAEYAATDNKDSNERKWRKLLHVHKFLNNFLKAKMEREMEKFKIIEQAYQKIKASTGIQDTNEIVNKYLNREQIYSQLLVSIAEYEKRLEELRKNNENLKHVYQKLKDDLVPLETSVSKKPGANLEQPEYMKAFDEFMEKHRRAKILKDHLHSFMIKNLVKVDRITQKAKLNQNISIHDLYHKDNANSIIDSFSKIFEMVDKDLKDIPREEEEQILKDLNKSYQSIEFNEEYFKRNCRVAIDQEQINAEAKDVRITKSESDFIDSEGESGQKQKANDTSNDEEVDWIEQNRGNIKSLKDGSHKENQKKKEKQRAVKHG